MAGVEDDARQFAELLRRLDRESASVAGAAMDRLKYDHDGSFTWRLEGLYQRRFRTEDERIKALWELLKN